MIIYVSYLLSRFALYLDTKTEQILFTLKYSSQVATDVTNTMGVTYLQRYMMSLV